MSHRSNDANGDGAKERRWHMNPAVPVTAIIALIVLLVSTTAYVVSAANRSLQNTRDITDIRANIETRLASIDRKLDQLFQPRLADRR